MSDKENVQETKIEELVPTNTDNAKKAFAQVFRDQGVQLSADYIALAQSRIDLIKKLYSNVVKLDEKIFEEKNFKTMSMKEALYCMAMHLKAIGSLNVSFEEHKATVDKILVQINLLFKNDDVFAKIPVESRKRIQNAVSDVLAHLMTNVNKEDDKIIDVPAETPLYGSNTLRNSVLREVKSKDEIEK